MKVLVAVDLLDGCEDPSGWFESIKAQETDDEVGFFFLIRARDTKTLNAVKELSSSDAWTFRIELSSKQTEDQDVLQSFLRRARAAGADALLVADCNVELNPTDLRHLTSLAEDADVVGLESAGAKAYKWVSSRSKKVKDPKVSSGENEVDVVDGVRLISGSAFDVNPEKSDEGPGVGWADADRDRKHIFVSLAKAEKKDEPEEEEIEEIPAEDDEE